MFHGSRTTILGDKTMRKFTYVLFIIGLTITSCATALGQPRQAAADSAENGSSQRSTPKIVMSSNEAVDRIIDREHEEIAAFRRFHPLIESYVQDANIRRDEPKLWRDWYLLGHADLGTTLNVRSLISWRDQPPTRGIVTGWYDPIGFLNETFVDRTRFDKQHYKFEYAGAAFLGAVRCLMFDVEPRPDAHRQGADNDEFRGRIWAEDQGYTIVRFSGRFLHQTTTYWVPVPHKDTKNYPHFDSWRLNVQPGLWLPAYIFTEQTSPSRWHGPFKAQTRLWAYDVTTPKREEVFTGLAVESTSPIEGNSNQGDNLTPIDEQREWRGEAERNAEDTLERDGLLAPLGPVDHVLDTVVNNLEVTNDLDIKPEIRCRVLMTSNLEMFSMGHTIVLSRGLIDVLPDEATLAVMLAQQVASIVSAPMEPDRFGFGDTLQVSPEDIFHRFASKQSKETVRATNEQGLAYLRKSPYKDRLVQAGLFLEQLRTESNILAQLINPNLGNSVYVSPDLLASAPALKADQLDQIAALPLGSRTTVDPWNDQIQLLKASQPRLVSSREKIPFEITPFVPYLARYVETAESQDNQSLGAVPPTPAPTIVDAPPTLTISLSLPSTVHSLSLEKQPTNIGVSYDLPATQGATTRASTGESSLREDQQNYALGTPTAYRARGTVWHYVKTHKELLVENAAAFTILSADAAKVSSFANSCPSCVAADPVFGRYSSKSGIWMSRLTFAGIHTVYSHLVWHALPDHPHIRRDLVLVPISFVGGGSIRDFQAH
jgi:hypothetical protein